MDQSQFICDFKGTMEPYTKIITVPQSQKWCLKDAISKCIDL